jgi:hypothetical protein
MVSDDVRERVTSYIKHQAGKSTASIVDLVRTSQEGLLAALDGVPEDVAAKKPAPDEWSLHDLIRHVIDAEDSVARIVERLSRGDPPERVAVAGSMVDGAGAFSDLVARLRASNRRLLDTIAALPADANREAQYPHPFFGPLNCCEWAAFQRVHDADHLQHAGKIIAAVS